MDNAASFAAKKFRTFIEQAAVKVITQLSSDGSATPERTQELAKRCLELIKPQMTIEELYRNAVKLDDHHPEFAPVVIYIMKAYEEVFEKKALEQVSSLIKQGHYDEAEQTVKKILQFKSLN